MDYINLVGPSNEGHVYWTHISGNMLYSFSLKKFLIVKMNSLKPISKQSIRKEIERQIGAQLDDYMKEGTAIP